MKKIATQIIIALAASLLAFNNVTGNTDEDAEYVRVYCEGGNKSVELMVNVFFMCSHNSTPEKYQANISECAKKQGFKKPYPQNVENVDEIKEFICQDKMTQETLKTLDECAGITAEEFPKISNLTDECIEDVFAELEKKAADAQVQATG